MIDMIGQRIHSYEINAHLGRGGMGNVFKATDSMLDREVALKVLHPQLTIQPLFLDRFRKEARVLAQLLHPNIAVIYNFFEQDGNHFMVMEYVEGTSLDDLLKKYQQLPASFVIPVFIQALEGLHHAHRKNIFHRDIKPANLMLTGDGILKLMDFGIAKIAGEQKMTQINKIIGTLEFMAPELIEGKDASIASDVYSMGATLYELVSGKIPFEGDTDFNIMQAIMKSKLRSPDKLNPAIPRALNEIILKSMDRHPEHRYPNARALQQALINAFPNYREIDLNVLKQAKHSGGVVCTSTAAATKCIDSSTEHLPAQVRVKLARPLANLVFFKERIQSNKRTVFVIAGLLLMVGIIYFLTAGSDDNKDVIATTQQQDSIVTVQPAVVENSSNAILLPPQNNAHLTPSDNRIKVSDANLVANDAIQVPDKKPVKIKNTETPPLQKKSAELTGEISEIPKKAEAEKKEIYINRPVIFKLSLTSNPDMNQKKKAEQPVNFSVTEPVFFDGVMIIKPGATAKGSLTIGSRKTDIRILNVEAANGSVIGVKSVNEHGRRDDIELKRLFTAQVQPGVKLTFN